MTKKTYFLALLVSSGLTFANLSVQAGWQEGQAALANNDYATALREFQAGASNGEAPSMYGLAEMYLKEQGVKKNDTEALNWYGDD
jgi:TPR repeat protein